MSIKATVRVNSWQGVLKKRSFSLTFKIKTPHLRYTFRIDEPYNYSYDSWTGLVEEEDATLEFSQNGGFYITKRNGKYNFVTGVNNDDASGLGDLYCPAVLIDEQLLQCINMLNVGGLLP